MDLVASLFHGRDNSNIIQACNKRFICILKRDVRLQLVGLLKFVFLNLYMYNWKIEEYSLTFAVQVSL